MKTKVRLALYLLPALAAGCQLTPSLVAVPRIGGLSIDGDVNVSSSGASVSSNTDELGLEDDNVVFEPRLDFGWGPAHVMATAYSAEYDGRGAAKGQLDLGGVVISAGEQVESSLDITSANVVTTFDLIPTDVVDLGLGVGARVIDFDGQIRSLSSGQSIGSSQTFVMPVVAVRGAAALGPFDLSLIGSGLTGSYANIDATVVDLDLMGEYRFDEFLGFHGSLVLGYRYIGVDVEFADQGGNIDANLDFSGPYVGLALGI